MQIYTIMTDCKLYPKVFIEKCKQILPDNKQLIKYLEEGNKQGVGGILNQDVSLTPNLIVSSFETSYSEEELNNLPESLLGLYKRAKKQEDLDYLFGWFLEIIAE